MIFVNNNTPLRVAIKLANQSVISQTLIQPDSELALQLDSRHRYLIRGWIPFFLVGTASGYRFGLTIPVGSANVTYTMKVFNCNNGALVDVDSFEDTGVISGALAASGKTHLLEITGQIETGDVGGQLAFGFSQFVSDVSAIILLRSSFLELTDYAY